MLRETEENPFEADEDEDDIPNPSSPSHSRQTSAPSDLAQSSQSSTPSAFLRKPNSNMTTKKSKKDKKGSKKPKAFSLEAEKETMKNCIAESNIASTNLLNALRLINREHQQISENKAAVHHFEFCKLLRRKILRYVRRNRYFVLQIAADSPQIQLVEAEEWLGALLTANDSLVTALMTFEQLDNSIDADSDSDDELAEQAHLYKREPNLWRNQSEQVLTILLVASEKGKESETTQQLASLQIGSKSGPVHEQPPAQPPRPAQPPEDEDENDPFADRNAVATPQVERSEPSW